MNLSYRLCWASEKFMNYALFEVKGFHSSNFEGRASLCVLLSPMNQIFYYNYVETWVPEK